jgi:hypothetical protein
VLPDQLSRACHLSRQKSCWRDDLTKGVITAPNPCWVTLLQKADPSAHWDLLLNSSISSWLWITYAHLKKATKTWHLCNYFNCRKHAHINMATQKDRKWNPSKIGQIRGRLLSFGGCHMLLWTNNLNDNQSSQYFI